MQAFFCTAAEKLHQSVHAEELCHGSTSALFGPSPFWPRPASILQIHGKYVCEKKCPLICKEQDQKISQKDCQTECEKICREECHQIC